MLVDLGWWWFIACVADDVLHLGSIMSAEQCRSIFFSLMDASERGTAVETQNQTNVSIIETHSRSYGRFIPVQTFTRTQTLYRTQSWTYLLQSECLSADKSALNQTDYPQNKLD